MTTAAEESVKKSNFYLHYYLGNSGFEAHNYNAEKEALQANVLNKFKSRLKTTSGNYVNDGTGYYDLFKEFDSPKGTLGGALDQALASAMQNKKIATSATKVGTTGNSMQQMGNIGNILNSGTGKVEEAGQKAEALCQDLGNIIADMESLVEEVEQYLQIYYKEAYEEAVDKAADSSMSALPGAERDFLTDCLKNKNNFTALTVGKKFSGNAAGLANGYLRLVKRLNALKVLGGNSTGYDNAEKGKFIATLVGKMGGTFSNVAGEFEEIIAAEAVQSVLNAQADLGLELNDALETKLSTAVAGVTGGGGFNFAVNVKQDPKITEWIKQKQGEQAETYSLNDVTIVISTSGGYITYGASVKTSRTPTNPETGLPIGNVKIHDTSLYQILSDSRLKMPIYKAMQLAAGHDTRLNGSGAISGASSTWSSYLWYAVMLNFVDYLAGRGTVTSNSTIMIVNGKLLRMEEILGKVAANVGATGDNRGIQVTWNGATQRKTFQNLNAWKGISAKQFSRKNTEMALKRSGEAYTAVMDKFKSTKVKISLNFNALYT